MKKLVALGVVAISLGSLVACGGEPSSEDEVKDVVIAFYAALGNSDFDEACTLVSSTINLDGADCESALEAVETKGEYDPERYGDFVVDQVEVSGDDATVELRGDEGTSKLAKAVSGWKIVENTSLDYGTTLLSINEIGAEIEVSEDEIDGYGEPDVSHRLKCDYLLGDSDYRFVGGGRVKNDGPSDVRVRVNFTWIMLGSDPVKHSETVRVPSGQGRDVQVSVPASIDEISAHQSADGECRSNARVLNG